MVHPLPERAQVVLESGYRHWGHDITDEKTSIEAKLGFTIGDEPNPYDGHPDGVVGDWLDTGRVEINVGGELVAATLSIRSFYDPKNQRVRLEDGP